MLSMSSISQFDRNAFVKSNDCHESDFKITAIHGSDRNDGMLTKQLFQLE